MSVLDGILAGVHEDLERRKSETPLTELRARAVDAPPAIDPMRAFRASGVSIIAEVKRKSPSKGHTMHGATGSAYVRPWPAQSAGQGRGPGGIAGLGGHVAAYAAATSHASMRLPRKES
ncbi:hypothetical protein AB0M44_43665 [Streptosporangium subroseum]|uniref:hypothetical protein n=1 Tax=Streptosporangium subroseum TaxID=106412 RepID=UPI00341BC422